MTAAIIKKATEVNPKTVQPNAIATGPAVADRRPFVVVAIANAPVDAAMCCHNAETRQRSDAMPNDHAVTCMSGREGNGLTSKSEPVLASCSSCHPGNVERMQKASAQSAMAASLQTVSVSVICTELQHLALTVSRTSINSSTSPPRLLYGPFLSSKMGKEKRMIDAQSAERFGERMTGGILIESMSDPPDTPIP